MNSFFSIKSLVLRHLLYEHMGEKAVRERERRKQVLKDDRKRPSYQERSMIKL